MRFLGRHLCAVLFLALLAVFEAVMVNVLVRPYNSTRLDWLVTTLFLAPLAAGSVLLFLIMLPLRIAADVIAVVRGEERN